MAKTAKKKGPLLSGKNKLHLVGPNFDIECHLMFQNILNLS